MTRDGIVFKKPFERKVSLNRGRESVSFFTLTDKEKSIAEKYLNILRKLVQGEKRM